MTPLHRALPVLAAAVLSACSPSADRPASVDAEARVPSEVLYVWSADADEADPDFLAVVDAASASPTYGQVIGSVAVEGRGHFAHHTEYELSSAGTLFANGWGTGSTFVFDLADPRAPTVRSAFTARGDFAYPHSYARLPNGNVLATFQTTGSGYAQPGGLVELDASGNVVRSVSGVSPDVPANETWTYSLLVLPDIDRVVSTNTRMGLPAEWKSAMRAAADTAHHHVNQDVKSTHVQVWRLSDLALLHTLKLPPQEGGHNTWTAEPRRLANGEVYVNTFSCGLYRIVGLATERPTAEAALFSRFREPGFCAVPVVLGNFWIQPSATEGAITTYDLSDPAKPREASRLVLDSLRATPHWLALDPSAPRLVATSDDGAWVLIVDIDPATGALTIDERFRDAAATRAGISFDRPAWPHGAGGRAMPHGALFGPGRRP